MKISCEIIKDLLPLYHDGVCSNDTKIIVEEHLTYCDSYNCELESMDELPTINNVDQNLKEAESVKNYLRGGKKEC